MQHANEALDSEPSALNQKRRVDRAKFLPTSRYGLTEQAAHERLQRAAADGGVAGGSGTTDRQIVRRRLSACTAHQPRPMRHALDRGKFDRPFAFLAKDPAMEMH